MAVTKRSKGVCTSPVDRNRPKRLSGADGGRTGTRTPAGRVSWANSLLVAGRVLLLPAPVVGQHVVEAAGRPPAQDLGGQRRVGPDPGDVPGASPDDLVGYRCSDHLACCRDHLEHRVSDTGSEVDRRAATVRGQGVERRHVALGQVDHVDVVAHRRTVGRVVVAAEDVEVVAATNGDLHEQRDEVGGHAGRVLADGPAGMGAHGVEVAQQHDVECRRLCHVGQQSFADQLGRPVGVCRPRGRGLGHRDDGGLAVDGARRGEHEA